MDNKDQLSPSEAEKIPLIIVVDQSLSSRNPRKPEDNQDRILNLGDMGVYGVFDGMGGMLNGGLFAEAAKNHLGLYLQQGSKSDPVILAQKMAEAFYQTSLNVAEEVPGNGGTTAAVVVVREHNGTMYATVGGVGDSSIMLFRNGELVKLVDEDNGAIEHIVKQKGLSGEAALQEMRKIAAKLDKVLTQGDYDKLSAEESVELLEGDLLLKMTDGIRDCLTNQEIIAVLKTLPANQRATGLNSAAQYRAERPEQYIRGKRDDRAIIVLSVQGKPSDNPYLLPELKKINSSPDLISDPKIRLPQPSSPQEISLPGLSQKPLKSLVN